MQPVDLAARAAGVPTLDLITSPSPPLRSRRTLVARRKPVGVGPDEIAALSPLIRQVLRTRVGDGEHVDDLVQTCVAKLIERRAGLSSDTLAGYAIVVARNAAATRSRELDRHRRQLPRLLDLRSPADPADEAARAEEVVALRQAISKLAPEDREALVAHDLDQVDTATLAARTATTPAGVASRLNRTRGRLRVEYLLAVQRTALPTRRCHPVLVALSTADHRRQHALHAARHLVECHTCAALSAPLIERRRGALVLLPLVVLADRLRPAERWIRTHPVHAAVATTTTAAVVVGVLALSAPGQLRDHPAPSTTVSTASVVPARRVQPPPSLTANGDNLLAALLAHSPREVLGPHRGQTAQVRNVTVTQLAGAIGPNGRPDDERFWIGARAGRRILVFLHIDAEPPNPITVGRRYDFTGTIQPVPADPHALDLRPTSTLEAVAAGYYIEITSLADLRLTH